MREVFVTYLAYDPSMHFSIVRGMPVKITGKLMIYQWSFPGLYIGTMGGMLWSLVDPSLMPYSHHMTQVVNHNDTIFFN